MNNTTTTPRMYALSEWLQNEHLAYELFSDSDNAIRHVHANYVLGGAYRVLWVFKDVSARQEPQKSLFLKARALASEQVAARNAVQNVSGRYPTLALFLLDSALLPAKIAEMAARLTAEYTKLSALRAGELAAAYYAVLAAREETKLEHELKWLSEPTQDEAVLYQALQDRDASIRAALVALSGSRTIIADMQLLEEAEQAMPEHKDIRLALYAVLESEL